MRGEADHYGSKFYLLLMPVIVTVLAPLIALLARLDPRAKHVAESQGVLLVVLGGLLFVLTAVHAAMVFISLGHALPMDRIVVTSIGLLFVLIGTQLGRMKSNFLMGIRTPWTLSSELSWRKTHRLAARLFFAVGAATVVLMWTVGGPIAVAVLVASLFIVTIAIVVYSYVVWKRDPGRPDGAGA